MIFEFHRTNTEKFKEKFQGCIQELFKKELDLFAKRGCIVEPNPNQIEKIFNELLSSPCNAVNYLLDDSSKLLDFFQNPIANKDEYYLPLSFDHTENLNAQEKTNAISKLTKEAESFAKIAVGHYKKGIELSNQNNDELAQTEFSQAIKNWQMALKCRKNSAYIGPDPWQLSYHYDLYWDGQGNIALLYKNLAAAYSRLPGNEKATLYCYNVCKLYIDLGYGHFYSDPQLIINRYNEIFTTYQNILASKDIARLSL